MATSNSLRRRVDSLADDATRDLSRLWRRVDSAAQAANPLRDVLPAIVDTYGLQAGALAAAWYDDERERASIPGRFEAFPAAFTDTGTDSLVGWAFSEANDLPAFQTLIEGGTQRRIANFARETVKQSSIADPHAKGWRRTGAGRCEFCALLISRGAVYTQSSVTFRSHDHCHCGAEPAWR